MAFREPTVLLACLEGGEHVQIGKPREHADAYDLFERLDNEQAGYCRDKHGALRFNPIRKAHYFGGRAVSFYRLRQVGHEFGQVKQYRVRDLRYTENAGKSLDKSAVMGDTSIMKNTKTPSGIKRPEVAVYTKWDRARSVAREANKVNGRGFRALKTAKGDGYTVIFRPAVAGNKQRKVREVVR